MLHSWLPPLRHFMTSDPKIQCYSRQVTVCTGNFTSQIHTQVNINNNQYCSNSTGLHKTVTREFLPSEKCRIHHILPKITFFANFFLKGLHDNPWQLMLLENENQNLYHVLKRPPGARRLLIKQTSVLQVNQPPTEM